MKVVKLLSAHRDWSETHTNISYFVCGDDRDDGYLREVFFYMELSSDPESRKLRKDKRRYLQVSDIGYISPDPMSDEELIKALENLVRTSFGVNNRNSQFRWSDKPISRFSCGMHEREYEGKYEVLKESPEDLFLTVPDFYQNTANYNLVQQYGSIDEKALDDIKTAVSQNYPIIVYGINRATPEDYDVNGEHESPTFVNECLCTSCGAKFAYQGKRNNGRIVCPQCSNSVHFQWSDGILYPASLKKLMEDSLRGYGLYSASGKQRTTNKFFVVEAKGNGVVISKVVWEVAIKKENATSTIKAESQIRFLIGEDMASYKINTKGEKACDPLKILNLNSKNILCPPRMFFGESENFMEFAINNQETLKKIGFIDCMTYAPREMNMESLFVLYVGLTVKYPVFEKIVKMGHAGLFFKMFEKLKNAERKSDIDRYLEQVGEIVNADAVKGKDSLRIPNYIGEYLIKKSADINEYLYWRDIYEVASLSKEQFEKLINSFEFAYLNCQRSRNNICNIIKYGYEPLKVMKYIMKQSAKKLADNQIDTDGEAVDSVVDTLHDYLRMNEILGIKPDMYPMDLYKQHDDMAEMYRRHTSGTEIKYVKNLACECDDYVNGIKQKGRKEVVGVPNVFFDYEIVFPASQNDFVNEGNMQRNCVGTYYSSVIEKKCVIFFIRKKESPDKSFITAECRRSGGLGQLYFANNRHVYDSELIKLGEYVCKQIKKGVSVGKIDTFN